MGDELLGKIGTFIVRRLARYEIILIAIVLLPVAAWYYKVPGFEVISYAILTLTGVIYFFSAFGDVSDLSNSGFDIVVYKSVAIATSIVLEGILYRIKQYPLAGNFIIISGGALALGLILILYRLINDPDNKIFHKFLVVRIIVFCIIAAMMLFYSH